MTSSVIYSAVETGRQQDCNKAFAYLIRNWLSEMRIDVMFCILKANSTNIR